MWIFALNVFDETETNPFMKLDIRKTSNYKGYTALLGENTDPEGRGDLHEGL